MFNGNPQATALLDETVARGSPLNESFLPANGITNNERELRSRS